MITQVVYQMFDNYEQDTYFIFSIWLKNFAAITVTLYRHQQTIILTGILSKIFVRFVLCPGFVISGTYESMSPNLAFEIKLSNSFSDPGE